MGDLQFTLPPVEKSKKQVAYEFIKEHIVSGDFPAGSLLVERQLCAMINTSRTPVREAIQQLTAEGLVESISAKGNVVSSIRYEDIARTYDVREYLESLAVRLCVQVCTDAVSYTHLDVYKRQGKDRAGPHLAPLRLEHGLPREPQRRGR